MIQSFLFELISVLVSQPWLFVVTLWVIMEFL